MAAIPLERLEGKYEILEKLQEGGMGAIYKVRHRLLGEVRVIKVIRPHLEQDTTLQTRFLEEARAAARLSHPNLAHLYDYTVDEDGAAYIVMEFIPGLTLGELRGAGELLPLGLALEVARQALKAIGHIHRHGIAHRDISPDNLMLTTDVDGRPLVKLLDLGLAKTVGAGSQVTAAGVFVGKFRYAAPEQFDAFADEAPEGEDRRPSDLYAFAVVLYELLTGRYPIAGSTPSSLIAGHLFRPPLDFAESDPEGRVPETVRRAVLKGLAKNPPERFASAEELAAALDDGRALDLASVEVRRLLDLVRRQALPRLAPSPSRGSTQSRLDLQFVAEPTPSPAAPAAGPTLVPAPPPEDPAKTRQLPRPGPIPAAAPADAVELAVPRIEELIEDGDLAGARRRVRELAAAAPQHPRLAELTARLAEIERIANRSRVRELLGSAQEEARRDRHPAALEALRRALELAPEDDQVQALYSATERQLRRQQEAAARERAIAERGARIAELLELGELEEAARALKRAGESFGGHPRWSALRQRLAAARSAVAERRSPAAETAEAPPGSDPAELLRQARDLHRRGRLAEAIARARRAEELAPQHKMIQVLLFELEQELAAERQSAARETSRRAAEEEIRQLVDGGEIEAAAERLPEALEVAGPTLVLKNLQAQVAKEIGLAGEQRQARGRTRRQRADGLVAEARSRAAADEFTAAGELLRQALAAVPDHPEALTLRTSVEACVRVQEEELRQAEEVERTVANVRSLLDDGRAADALTTLSRATTRLGDHNELHALHYEAAQARLDDAGARSGEAAQEATSTAEIGDADVERSAKIDALVPRIRALTAAGDVGQALETLQQALDEHGPLPSLQELRDEIGEAMLERDAEQEASGSRMIAIPPATAPAAAPSPALPERGLPEREMPTLPMAAAPSGLGGAWAPTEVRPAATVLPPPPSFDQIALDGMVKEEPPAAAPAPAPRDPSRRSGLPGGHSGRAMLIAGLLVVIVLFCLMFLLSQWSSSRQTAPQEPVTEDVSGRALDPGLVVLDAVPWAEIVRVVPVSPEVGPAAAEDARIAEDIPITPSHYTPVALELPPGRYRIELRYPPAGVSQEIEVEVASGARQEQRLIFEELDGKRYFDQIGY